MMTARFAMRSGERAAILYTWSSYFINFDRTDMYNGKEVCHDDIKFEQACILHNLGALHAELGAKDERMTDEDQVGGDYTPDVSHAIISFYIQLMLGQAQECILEKSIKDNRKGSLIARIAAQIISYLRLGQNILEAAVQIISSRRCKVWSKFLTFKIVYYDAVAHLYMANSSDENSRFGDKVGYLKAASAKLEECSKLLKQGIDAKFQDVYNYTYDVINYHEEKAQLLRSVTSSIQQKNEELSQVISSLQLPNLNRSDMQVQMELPSEISEINQQLNSNPDVLEKLIELIEELKRLYQDIEDKINATDKKLNEENQAAERFESKFGIVHDAAVFEELKSKFERRKEANDKAMKCNDEVFNAYDSNIENLKLLNGSKDALMASLPKLNLLDIPIDEAAETNLRRILAKVEEMKKQRSNLEGNLREALNEDDITSMIVTQTNKDSTDIFHEQIQKHDSLVNVIRQNLAAQERIIMVLTDANAKYGAAREQACKTSAKRNAYIKSLMLSYNVMNELISKAEHGIEFYKKFANDIEKFSQKIEPVIQQRLKEREQKAREIVAERRAKKNAELMANNTPIANTQRWGLIANGQVTPTSPTNQQNLNKGMNFNTASPTALPLPNRDDNQFFQGRTDAAPSSLQHQQSLPSSTYSQSTIPVSPQSPHPTPASISQQQQKPLPMQPQSPQPLLSQQRSPVPLSSVNQISAAMNSQSNVSTPVSLPYQANIPSHPQNQLSATRQVSSGSMLPQNNYQSQQLTSGNATIAFNDNLQYQNSQSGSNTAPNPQRQISQSNSTAVPNAIQRQISNPNLNQPNSQHVSFQQPSSGNVLGPHTNVQRQDIQSNLPQSTTALQNQFSNQGLDQKFSGYPTYQPQLPSSQSAQQPTQVLSRPQNQQAHTIQSQSSAGQAVSQHQHPGTFSQGNIPSNSSFNIRRNEGIVNQSSKPAGDNTAWICSNQQQPSLQQQSQNQGPTGFMSAQPLQQQMGPRPTTQTSYVTVNNNPSMVNNLPSQSAKSTAQSTVYVHSNPVMQQMLNTQQGGQSMNMYNQTNSQGQNMYGNSQVQGGISTAKQQQQQQFTPLQQVNQQGPVRPYNANMSQANSRQLHEQGQYNGAPPAQQQKPQILQPVQNQQFPPRLYQAKNNNQPVDLLTSSVDQFNLQGTSGSTILSPVIAGSKPAAPTQQKPLLQSFSREYIDKLRSDTMQFGQNMQSLCYSAQQNCDGFTTEFQALEESRVTDSRKYPCNVAHRHPIGNRDETILPYDYSRVILSPQYEGDEGYINSSLIDDLTTLSSRYIATQPPLPSSFTDFWRMIWETNALFIAMLVAEIENCKRVCDRYWPENVGSSVTYGAIVVTLASQEAQPYGFKRIITIKKNTESRSITQLQLITWPQPFNQTSYKPLMAYLEDVTSHLQKIDPGSQAPVVVHCSDGVGRTGAFCILYTAIKEMAGGHGLINISKLIQSLRQRRNYMVRTKDQYIMCYEAVFAYASKFVQEAQSSPSDSSARNMTGQTSQQYGNFPVQQQGNIYANTPGQLNAQQNLSWR
ncbi:uncharacterized protein TRIADDRAFT_60390 [Trichoplax adhaerens]|uniref:Tyrosine-protein phosphatase non-receptor type 23 n=1 Tax=Trichoplax adhaerens TaxID=10228 RepID=B3S834_TRIAD|nr:hypothetical protein TRIADDRAFT_60390 [Trichoplax adhaerens]EDV21126.1 hypothetical protein TRIADDRAFT_60390 [Trichoplax adhaerens]|eukprot:XP_002116456.1 hypothetical protein TRIADDRAFT_60390 [Trichoplax adhaerens]